MDPKTAKRFYNTIAPECGEERQFIVDRVRPQLARSITPGSKLLDLGCGAGRFTFAAEEMGAIAVGIDCAEVLLHHAREVAQHRGSCAQFIEGDYTSLPFAPASFDVALLMSNIVECSYQDLDTLLKQLRTILSPGGVFCLEMPDRLAQHQRHNRSLMDYDPSTGRMESTRTTPDQQKIPWYSYFWTAAFAKHICSRYLALHEDEPLSEERHWLAFRNDP